jgi:hypothetical protein
LAAVRVDGVGVRNAQAWGSLRIEELDWTPAAEVSDARTGVHGELEVERFDRRPRVEIDERLDAIRTTNDPQARTEPERAGIDDCLTSRHTRRRERAT